MAAVMADLRRYLGPVRGQPTSEWTERFRPYLGLVGSAGVHMLAIAYWGRSAVATAGVLAVLAIGLAIWIRRSAALFEPGQVTLRTLTWTRTYHATDWLFRERQGAYSIIWLGLESADGQQRIETSSLARPSRIRWYPRTTAADRSAAAARRAGFAVERLPDPFRDFVEKHQPPED